MITRSLVLAVALLLAAVSITAAQSPESQQLGTSSTGHSTGAMTEALVVQGWNWVRIQNCWLAGSTLGVSAQDGSIWYTSDLGAIALLTPACQTGHLVAFYVYNAFGNWNIYTYTF